MDMDTHQKDDLLWKIAKRRAAFKWNFSVYLAVHTGLISVWFITAKSGEYFWPVWSLLGWGIGIIYQYMNAYQHIGIFSADSEYEKLKKQNHP
jgi:hypothetical protein